MKFIIGDVEYRIIFWHYTTPVAIMPVVGKQDHIKVTRCAIVHAGEQFSDEKNWLTIGYAHCHPSDNYSKETGRKLSLARAIKDLQKQHRRTIWQAYLNRNVTEGTK